MASVDASVSSVLDLPRRIPRRALMVAARASLTFAVGFVAVLAVLLVGLGAVTGLVGRGAEALPVAVTVPDDVEFGALEERSVIYARDGSRLAVLHDEHDRRFVPLDQVPDHVVHAVLAAEDRRFFEHDGYDAAGIARALLANLEAQRVEQGGSTLTQQLAKQNFVGDDRTLERKFDELAYAVAMEQRFSKEELLERYLNEVYFGSGSYGIATAAYEYFRVEPDELNPAQAALLAGMIRAPGTLDPRSNPEGAEQRRNQVLAAMAEAGWLERDDAATLAAVEVAVEPPHEYEIREPYVVEAVKRAFLDDPAFGDTREARVDALFAGGLEIHTTIDPDLQAVAKEVVEAHVADLDGPTAALAAVHPPTGQVLAAHGGADFDELQFDLATQGRRQPGSAFKPFVLATALENGVPLGLRVEGDSGAAFDVGGWREEDDGVRNFGGASYGQVSLREALVRSVNTAFADLILTTGVEPVIGTAGKLGIDTERAFGAQDGPALALGGVGSGATPLEMASAYGVFANAGQHAEAHLIERVVDRSGEELYVHATEAQQALAPEVNAAMVDIMRDVVTQGTGTAAQLPGWDVAGKTGTSQRSSDAWFAGFTAPLSTAVWIGHPEGQVEMPGMTGGSVPAQIWRDFMTRALEGRDPEPFPDADVDFSTLERGDDVDVPDVRGLSQNEAQRALGDALLVPVVRMVDDGAPAGLVLWQSPAPDQRLAAGGSVVIGVSTGTPPPPPEPEPEPEPDEPDEADDPEADEDAESDEDGEGDEAAGDGEPAPDDAEQQGGDGGDGNGSG